MSRRRRPAGCVYQRAAVWWTKWIDGSGRPVYRSSGSEDAERMLREKLGRRDRGLAPTPDPGSPKGDDLLATLEADDEARGRRVSTV